MNAEEKSHNQLLQELVAAQAQLSQVQAQLLTLTGIQTLADRQTRAYQLFDLLSQQFSEFGELEVMLETAVHHLQQAFAYYHVQVYTSSKIQLQPHVPLDPTQEEKLILRTGTGEAGRKRKKRGFSIPLNARRSLVALAARERQTIVVNDTRKDPKHLPNLLLADTRAEAALPLAHLGRLLGVLDVQHTEPDCFDEAMLGILEIVARQFTLVLLHAEQRAAGIATSHRLQTLHAITTACAKIDDEDTLYQRITDIVGTAFQADAYGFRLLQAQSGNLRSHPSYHHIGSGAVRRGLLTTAPGEGISGRVAQIGQPWRVPDVTQEPAYLGDPAIRAALCVPLRVNDQVIGVLNIESVHYNAFNEEDEQLLLAIAGQSRFILERLRLSVESRHQRGEKEALLATMKAISSLQLEGVLNTIGQEACRLLQGDGCRIHLLEADGETLRCVVALTEDPQPVMGFTLKIGQGLTGSVALSGLPELVVHTRQDRRTIQIPDTPVRDTTAVFAPMKARQELLGVMTVYRYDVKQPYTQLDLNLLTAVADQAAVALENARLFDAERRKREILSLLNAVATAGAEAITENDLIERITRIGSRLYTDYFGFLFLDDISGVLRTHHAYIGPQMTVPVEQSIAGQVVTSGQPFLTADVTRERGYFESEFSELFQMEGHITAKVSVPIHVGDQTLGILNAESKKVGAFNDSDLFLLTTFARQAGTAIEKIRLFEVEHRRAMQQTALATAAEAILGAADVNELWPAINQAAQKTLAADRVGVYLYAPDNERLIPIHTVGISREYLDILNQHFPQMPGSQLLSRNTPLIINDVLNHPLTAAFRTQIEAEGFRAYALFPFISDQKNFLGTLAVYRNELIPFSDEDVSTGRMLGRIITIALQHIQHIAEKHLAMIRAQQLNDLGRFLATEQNLPTILATAVRVATTVIGADAGVIGLIVDDYLLSYYPYNTPENATLRPSSKGMGISWHIIENGMPLMLDDYASHPIARQHWVRFGIKAFLGMPVPAANGQIIGIINLFFFTPTRRFTLQDQQLLELVAQYVGTAIDNGRQFEELRKRIDMLAVTLSRQERQDRLKDNFIQSMSHELRTPLGIILGHADLLQDGLLGDLLPAQQESVQIISRRAHMLTSLVEDLSLLLAAETQNFRHEHIHPGQLIASMLADFRLQAQDHGILLQAEIAEDLPLIIGDETHLRRVFDNLMSNAFKFTPREGTVTLRVWREENDVRFEVKDTGTGIPTDQIGHIFERFYRATSNRRKDPGGAGLGLALVREIVQAHHGQVQVKSEEGVGTTLEVILAGDVFTEGIADDLAGGLNGDLT